MSSYKTVGKILDDYFKKLVMCEIKGHTSNFKYIKAQLKYTLKHKKRVDFDFETWYNSKKDIKLWKVN